MSALLAFAGMPGGMELLVILFVLLLLFGGGAAVLLGGSYLVLRGSGTDDDRDERIDELEREVADLRERLEAADGAKNEREDEAER